MSGANNTNMVRVIHYYRDLVRPSGVTTAINGWQKALIKSGVESIALHSGKAEEWDLPSVEIPHLGRGRQFSMPRIRGYLSKGDVLVLHEGWVLSNLAAALQAKILGVPYVVVPHGVYEPQVMRHLKFPFVLRKILEKIMLRNALAAHVFYDSEAGALRKLSRDISIFSVPTGLEASGTVWAGGGAYLAWFGRYSVEHKGLDRLLASYALVPPSKRLPLRLRGIDYQGGKSNVKRLVVSLGLEKWVSVGGPVSGVEKIEFLRDCEGFIFPSRWESQGIALLEAVSMGVPCLVSDSIHITASLVEHRAVRVTDFGNFPLASRDIQELPFSEHSSQAAYNYVGKCLSWPTVIGDYISNLNRYIDV